MKKDSTAFDSLFDTLFVVILVTVAPFLADLMQSSIYNYKIWASSSFVFPIIITLVIWAIAVFRDLVRIRIVGWFMLAYQIARAPFVIATQIMGLESFGNTVFGKTPIVVSVELILSIAAGYLIARQYHSLLRIKASLFDWLLPVIAVCVLAIYEIVVGLIL